MLRFHTVEDLMKAKRSIYGDTYISVPISSPVVSVHACMYLKGYRHVHVMCF